MKKVLVVEDSIVQGQVLRQSFEDQNYEVTIANNGTEAHGAIKSDTPDLIILDYILPDTDGISLCKSFKQNEILNSTPIIMFTSQTQLQYMVEAYEAGADYYVVKNEESNKVLRVLADSIFTRRARRKLLVPVA
jgi:DNA-binding response OmpR family regulator